MQVSDRATNVTARSFTVVRDAVSPTLTLSATVQGSDVLVTWDAHDGGSGLDASTCRLQIWGDGGWETLSVECAGETTHPAELGHVYTLRLSATDNVSNATSAEAEVLVPHITKYYYTNGQRIAMRQEDVVYYIHSDHLGSTSVLSDGSGQQAGDRVAYLPYGGLRLGDASTLPTDYTFTGQRDEAGLGLMHYGARFYSPRLGRFVSADSIVPEPGEPQALNRFAYVINNPVLYRDPSGHAVCIDEECNWIEHPVTGEEVWRVSGNPPIPPTWGCHGTLAECFGDVDRSRYGTKGYAYLGNHEVISEDEFNELLEVVYQDLRNQPTPIVIMFPKWTPKEVKQLGYIPGALAGRGAYDTPLWNARMADTVVCVEGHDCHHRSEVNYVAQGMWGAMSYQSLEDTLEIVEWWNQEGGHRARQGEYGHPASSGELYWTEVGWKWASNRLQVDMGSWADQFPAMPYPVP